MRFSASTWFMWVRCTCGNVENSDHNKINYTVSHRLSWCSEGMRSNLTNKTRITSYVQQWLTTDPQLVAGQIIPNLFGGVPTAKRRSRPIRSSFSPIRTGSLFQDNVSKPFCTNFVVYLSRKELDWYLTSGPQSRSCDVMNLFQFLGFFFTHHFKYTYLL